MEKLLITCSDYCMIDSYIDDILHKGGLYSYQGRYEGYVLDERSDSDIYDFLSLYCNIFEKELDYDFAFDLSGFREFCKKELSARFDVWSDEFITWDNKKEKRTTFEFDNMEYCDVRREFLDFFKKYDGKTLYFSKFSGPSQGEEYLYFSFSQKTKNERDYIENIVHGWCFYDVVIFDNNDNIIESVGCVYMPELEEGMADSDILRIVKSEVGGYFNIPSDVLVSFSL